MNSVLSATASAGHKLPERPRLLVLASTFPARQSDGVPAFVLDLARQESRDFAVTVLAPHVPGAPKRDVIENEHGGIEVLRFRYFFRRFEDLADGAILDNLKQRRSRWLQVVPFLVAQLFAISRTVGRTRPAAIHAHWVIPQGISATIAARRTPLLVTLHGGDIYALNGGIFRVIKRWVLGHAAGITTVNAQMQERVESWDAARADVHVIPMGVPLAEVAATPRPETTLADRAEERHVVVVGRLVEKKGFDVLLSALRDHAAHDNAGPLGWRITIAGGGPLRRVLGSQAKGLRVDFVGQLARADVLALIARSSVFVLPSVPAASGDQEGLPVVLLEAAALGASIVASDLPGINDAMTDGVTALLVPPGDPVRLANAIDRLLDQPELAARLGRAAAQRALDYSTEAVGERYRTLLRQIMSDGTRPPTTASTGDRRASGIREAPVSQAAHGDTRHSHSSRGAQPTRQVRHP